jgi:N-acetylneuraminic acid mutarotase
MRVLAIGIASLVWTLGLNTPGLAQDALENLPDQPIQLNTGPWREAEPIMSPRAGLSAVVLDEKIYAAGGAGLIEPRSDFEVYDPEFGSWRPLTALPVGLEGFGMAVWRDRIWVAGGYSSDSPAEAIDGVWSYDPNRSVWQSEAPLAGPKAWFSLISANDQLFAVGGEDGFEGIMVYDPEQVEWSARAAPDHVLRRGSAVISADDEIWVMGGVRDNVVSARVDIYSPSDNRWRRGPDMPEPRTGQSAVLLDGVLRLFGGRSADMRTTLDEQWYLSEDNWQVATNMPVPRTEAAAAVLNGEVWLIGGGAGAGFFAPFTAVDSVDVFAPDS